MDLKRLFILWLFFSMAFAVVSQNVVDSIEIRKGFGTVFRHKGKNMTPRQMQELVAGIPEAYKEMEIARTNNATASVFGFIGGFLVGWPLGTAIGGGDPNWALAGIGAGFIAISIPFSSSFTKHAKNAANLYNSGPKHSGLNQTELHIGMTDRGIGLRFSY